MTLQEAIEILDNHNKWRRGDEIIQMINPTDLGIAIDICLKELKKNID